MNKIIILILLQNQCLIGTQKLVNVELILGSSIMTGKNAIKLFEDRKIRTFGDENEEEWFFRLLMLYQC